MSGDKKSFWVFAGFFLFLTLLTYGLLIPWLGFYWDDWVFAWLRHAFGPLEFIPAFVPFRPLLGPIFALTTSLLGDNPTVWQGVGLAARFLIALSAWWSFCKVWPQNKLQVLLVVLLIIVYPGYGQQWIALTHVNQEFIPLIFYLLSFGMTALSIRDAQKKRWLLFALLFTFLGLFTTEYFIGFEALRGLILFYLMEGTAFASRIKKTLKAWSPYLALWVLNLAWLYVYYRSGYYTSYGVTTKSPLSDLFSIQPVDYLKDIASALWVSGVTAWSQVGAVFLPPYKLAGGAAILLSILAFGAITLFIHRSMRTLTTSNTRRWALEAIGLGLMGIIAGRLPSFVAGLPLGLNFDFDRLLISTLLGSAFLLAGITDLIFNSRRVEIYVLSALVAASIGFQFAKANTFKNDLELTQRFFWQLAWRIPALEPGTLLLTSQLPMAYESDFQLTAPLNWIYAPGQGSHELSYALLSTDRRLGGPKLPELAANEPIDFDYRTTAFSGSTAGMIALYAPLQSCLKVLDPVYFDQTEPFIRFIGPIASAIPYSIPARISTGGASPVLPEEILGREPEHTWCYYYEKADLARQRKDWQAARRLLDEAASKGYQPEDPIEWLLLIDTDARTGNPGQAHQWSLTLAENTPQTVSSLCKLWKGILADAPDPASAERARGTLPELGCSP